MFEGLIQPMHLLLVLGIVLIVFGPGKLPELGKGLGEAIRDFRRAMNPPPSQAKVTDAGTPAAAADEPPSSTAAPRAAGGTSRSA